LTDVFYYEIRETGTGFSNKAKPFAGRERKAADLAKKDGRAAEGTNKWQVGFLF
jgi:hypothetical protein